MIAALALAAASAAFGADRPPYPAERLARVWSVSEARIAPDGRAVAFITDITGAPEVWTAPAEGGWPEQLSDLGEAAADLRYAPDGESLIFTSDYGGDERPDLFLVPAAGGAVENLTRSTHAETGPRFSPNGRRVAYTADPGRPFLFQLMVMDLGSRAVRQLTREPVNVHFPVWSPDGAMIAVTRSGDDAKGELLLVAADSGQTRVILPAVKDGILSPRQFSANGKKLLCAALNLEGFMQLYLLDVASGEGRFIGPANWDVESALLDPKAGIIFTRNEGGVSALYRLAGPDRAEALLPAGGRIEMIDADKEGGRLAYLRGDARHPAEAWVFDLKEKRARGPVTRSVLGGVIPEALAQARIISYPSFDKRVIHAVYLKPPVARLGSPPPLVVVAHGGPDWQAFDDFNPLRQALAEAGFAVLAPNYRGSTGYGREFKEANRKDWGGADLKDLVWGARALAVSGEVDGRRVGVTGGSYGGYLTLMALAKSTGVWAAGVEAYGMPDLVQDYELTKDRFGDWYETQMGTPKTHAALFHERSAINFLDGIRAPLLIFQGANDTNVPKAESESVYDALKKRGADVELVVYPDEGHGFTKRKNRADYYARTVNFFARHLSKKR